MHPFDRLALRLAASRTPGPITDGARQDRLDGGRVGPGGWVTRRTMLRRAAGVAALAGVPASLLKVDVAQAACQPPAFTACDAEAMQDWHDGWKDGCQNIDSKYGQIGCLAQMMIMLNAARNDCEAGYLKGHNWQDCAGQCVDLSSDEYHCGSCTRECPASAPLCLGWYA